MNNKSLSGDACGAWWLSGKFGALHPEGRGFEAAWQLEWDSSCHAGALGKFFTHSCL